MSAQIVVPITRVRQAELGEPLVPLPRYMTPGSAGMDIAAALTKASSLRRSNGV